MSMSWSSDIPDDDNLFSMLQDIISFSIIIIRFENRESVPPSPDNTMLSVDNMQFLSRGNGRFSPN
jgi:hypothetical protein